MYTQVIRSDDSYTLHYTMCSNSFTTYYEVLVGSVIVKDTTNNRQYGQGLQVIGVHSSQRESEGVLTPFNAHALLKFLWSGM